MAARLTEKMVASLCQAHGAVVDESIRRLMSTGIPLSGIAHVYTPGDQDEYIVFNRSGYHIVHIIEGDEVKIEAHPGHWVSTNTPGQLKWVDSEKDAIVTPLEKMQGASLRLVN